MNWTESGTMKSVTRGMNNTSCGKCRRKKKSKDTKENNITMGTCLGLQSNGPTKILLVPCESQPSSSTRFPRTKGKNEGLWQQHRTVWIPSAKFR
ncbi:uncharacterized protein LOC114960855 isoform X5 [Acropora millepora]|uniref:uncharacterized protein LOC114960855 isoform X5 n=1 Tax=Acropora millepora TaxID=45264 RepID=UPI001CF483B1|nr:uncharacterized protein LOC114960855 isoform X5 [Acropora millepora]